MTLYANGRPDSAETPDETGEAPSSPECGCKTKHRNGYNEDGGHMPVFVDFATEPTQEDGRELYLEDDEAAFAAAIKRNRLAGWTAQRMRLFVLRLADTGNIHQCCRELVLSRQSAYTLRRRNEVFRRAWEGAVIRSRDALLDAAWCRAYQGPREEVVVDGKLAERQGKRDAALFAGTRRQGRQ